LLDGTTVLNPGGTALTANPAVSSQTFAQVFGTPDPGLAAAAQGEVIGDFNGDGENDLLVYGTNNATKMTLQVFLASSDGPGHFQILTPQTLTFSSYLGYTTPSVLDVDGDGKLDLLIGNTVASGKGDGTFSNAVALPVLATGFNQTYAADVNGDGKLDIVAVNTPPTGSDDPNNPTTVQLTFTVFRNDGGGTFTSLGTFPLAAPIQSGVGLCCVFYNVFSLSFADLNGDGKIDVLSQSNSVTEVNDGTVNQLNVMLNNGDGTYGPIKSLDTSPLVLAIAGGGGEEAAFGDLNGDGKLDLMLAYSDYSGTNYLASALGNGDGTFGSFTSLQLINFLTAPIPSPQIQAVDFNADGKLDAVLGSGELALGNGDGAFSLGTPLFPQPAVPQIPLNYPLLQANLFPDSWPSFVYLNFTTGANAVFTPQDSSSANTNVALSVGTHTLTAQYSGDSIYAAGISPAVTITVAPAVTTMAVTSSANPSYADQSVTFTATISGLIPGAGGTVTFSDGSTPLSTAPVSNGTASFTTTALSSAGSQTITAAYGGDANDGASSGSVAQKVVAPVTIGPGTGDSTSLTVNSGQSVTTQVSLAGAAGFSGSVKFSCTGLPMNASCSFSPASVTVSGTTAASTSLTVSTAATAMASARDGESSRALTVLACGLPLLGLLTLLPVARGRRLLLCLGFVLFVSVTSLTGCGGGSSGNNTAPGNYTFNVVATSGAATSTASYKLTVQ
jgi:hypothetical protein